MSPQPSPAPRFPTAGTTPPRRGDLSRQRQEWRYRTARALAEPHDGVVTHAMLLDAGITRDTTDREVDRGAWHRVGRHTISLRGPLLSRRASWWRGLWECGVGAFLDGETALLAWGLRGWEADTVHLSVPHRARVRAVEGVRIHRLREVGDTVPAGLRRTRATTAVLRAARWAATDRQAATLIAMAVQQRIVHPDALLDAWGRVARSSRRALLDGVIRDVCAGAESLGELDFARLCRHHGLPAPTRQAVRQGPRGVAYLDALWEEAGVHVEVHGAHHYAGLTTLDDALRGNALAIDEPGFIRLQIPVLGLRVDPDRFLGQVSDALARGGGLPRAA